MDRSILIFACVFATCASCTSQSCDVTQINDETSAINVLVSGSPSTTEQSSRKCIDGAIKALSQFRSKRAVPDLIRYLAFKEERAKEPSTVHMHPYVEGSDFPAVVALSRVGSPARGPLLEVIESPRSSALERQNAAHAILLSFLYEPNPDPGRGIRFVRDAESGEEATSRALMEEAISFMLKTPVCEKYAHKCSPHPR
jgi:hypothetical protein